MFYFDNEKQVEPVNARKRASDRSPDSIESWSTKELQIDAVEISRAILACRPAGATGAYGFKWSYLEKEILSKYAGSSGCLKPADLRKVAIQKMLASEQQCKEINSFGYRNQNDLLGNVLFYARSIVSDVLGRFDYSIFELGSFSGGASTSKRRRFGHAFYKYSRTKENHVTARAHNVAYALVSATPSWCSNGGVFTIKTCLGNTITTVPKNAKTDRCIAIEPDLNMHLQAAVGRHIRGRLGLFGVNLNDQGDNQRYAREGSIYGTYATIDLSSASDTISDRIVWDLLPPQWYEMLDCIRCHYGTLPNGDVIKWEKFSSMGNGFTFELESLIFWALAKAAQQVYRDSIVGPQLNAHTVITYGDDIIVPTYCATFVCEILTNVGFTVNNEKSFLSGPFRESCGKHYYQGIDVSPFYIRKPIDSVQRVVWLLNRIRTWSYSESLAVCDPSLERLWKTLRRKYVPACLLGGKDPDSISAVYSPNDPQKRLVEMRRSKAVTSHPALCVWFQNTLSRQTLHYRQDKESARMPYIEGIGETPVLSLAGALRRLSGNSAMSFYGGESGLKTESGGVYIPAEVVGLVLIDNDEPSWLPCRYLFPHERGIPGDR